MNTAFLVVSVLHPLAVLTTGGIKNTKQMEEEETQNFIGAFVVGFVVSGGKCAAVTTTKCPARYCRFSIIHAAGP